MKKVSHFVSCPFNPKHQVLEVRLLYHIYKCPDILEHQKTSSLFHCKYRWVHIFRTEEERDVHEAECSDKMELGSTKSSSEDVVSAKSEWLPGKTWGQIDTEENNEEENLKPSPSSQSSDQDSTLENTVQHQANSKEE